MTAPEKSAPAPGVKMINLALQGGGAHGAFAWGVLDRLVEDERIGIEGMVATSAGAMNATIFASGLLSGGRAGAKQALHDFWLSISRSAMFSPLQPLPWDRLVGDYSLESTPAYLFFDFITRIMSPYQLNPLNINPLLEILRDRVDFEHLRRESKIKLFLCATNVRTGKVKIFSNGDLSADAVMASGCLPFLFHTVVIDGEPYWDGGYMGNPPIFPLIYGCDSRDVVIVHINPIERQGVPKSAGDILNRLNEISFNSSLMREMRTIAFVTRMIDEGKIPDGSMKRMLIHAIEAFDYMGALGVSTKINPDWGFLTTLRDIGRRKAEDWLRRNFDDIGRDSTVDIRDLYL